MQQSLFILTFYVEMIIDIRNYKSSTESLEPFPQLPMVSDILYNCSIISKQKIDII